MKAFLSLILASLVLLGNPAYAERGSHQQRATRPAPRPMRARPPVRTVAPTSQPAVIPSSTRNETERSENPGQAPRDKQARPDEKTEADRSASPGQTPPAQSQVLGNQIGADPRDAVANGPNGTPPARAAGTWADDWADEGIATPRPSGSQPQSLTDDFGGVPLIRAEGDAKVLESVAGKYTTIVEPPSTGAPAQSVSSPAATPNQTTGKP